MNEELREKILALPLPEHLRWGTDEGYLIGARDKCGIWWHWWVYTKSGSSSYVAGDVFHHKKETHNQKKYINIPDIYEACQLISIKCCLGQYGDEDV